MKILIIQQKMIGDVLTSTILFEAIKEHYPKAELHYLINLNTLPVIKGNPFIDDVIIYTPEIQRSNLKLWHFIKSIRKNEYDVIIDVYSKLSSNLISFLSKAKTKISYHKKQSLFIYDHNIKRTHHSNKASGLEISNRLKLLTPLKIYKDSLKPQIYLTQEEIDTRKTYLENNGINFETPLYMVSVLGSSENKSYPLNFMAEIIDTIVAETKGQILFNYIPSQLQQAKIVYGFCKAETKKHIHFNIFGKNLREFLALTKNCDALIGNEGGAINMAKALDIPTFSIFSPWIKKEGWNGFENDGTHVSVHIKDFNSNLYDNKIQKEIKKEAKVFYEAFQPKYFLTVLKKFLKTI
jgi:heptosyltransferase-2